MKRPLLLTAAAAVTCVTLTLTGCALDNPIEAGDQTDKSQEVSAETVGQLAVATMGQSQAYYASIAPAGPAADNLSGATDNMVFGLSKSMNKAASAEAMLVEDCTIDSSDIALNRLTVSCTEVTSTATSSVTLTVKADQWETVYAFSAKTVHTGGFRQGLTEECVLTDGDGDGVIAAPGLSDAKALLTCTATYARDLLLLGHRAGDVEKLAMMVGAGPDGDFDAQQDNVIYEASWDRMRGGEKVAYAEYSDADGDGVILDNASTHASVVDIVLYEKNPPWRFFVEYNKLCFRLVTDGNEERDQVIKLYGEQKMISGRVNSIAVIDTSGDSVVTSGEIAKAIFATVVPSSADTVISSSASLVFDPVSGLCDKTDNLYYELHLSHEKRFGIVRALTYDFTTDEPVPEGQSPTSGHIELYVEYADGRSASIVADFADGYFSGTYTGPDGGTLSVTWDAKGNVVSQT